MIFPNFKNLKRAASGLPLQWVVSHWGGSSPLAPDETPEFSTPRAGVADSLTVHPGLPLPILQGDVLQRQSSLVSWVFWGWLG